jgi:hypothetical protein
MIAETNAAALRALIHGYVHSMIEVSFGCDHGGCDNAGTFRHDGLDSINVRHGVDVLIRDGWLFVQNQALQKVECFCRAHAPEREAALKEQHAKRRADDADRMQRRRLSWAEFDAANPDLAGRCCYAGKDGECNWPQCPQNRDGEPEKSGRHCPLDRDDDET